MAASTSPLTKNTHLSLASHTCLPPLTTSTSIRLINLEPGEKAGDIVMSADTYDLTDSHIYVALSYTWGDPLIHPYKAEEPSKAVWVNKRPFLITANLYEALIQWRLWTLERRREKTLLWIDAICIDQEDVNECNHQVRLMGQIYSNASLVWSWLGRSDEDALLTIKLISRLEPMLDLWQFHYDRSTYSYRPEKFFEWADIRTVEAKEWAALISFFERQYFCRAWIVQEVVLAKQTVLIVENQSIDWIYLTILAEMMGCCRWYPFLEQHAQLSQDTGRSLLGSAAPVVYEYFRFLHERYSSSTSDWQQYLTTLSDHRAFYNYLEVLLYETRIFGATEPHDKVYAALSIVSHAFGVQRSTPDLLSPDYRLPIRKVFIDVTHEIVSKTNRISILSLVHQEVKQVPDLPSWVPDYSASNPDSLAHMCHGTRYSAFSLVRRCLQPKMMNNLLYLCAIRWDTITAIGTKHPFILQGPMDLCLQLPKIYLKRQTRVEALWRTLTGDSNRGESPAPKTMGKSFRYSILIAIVSRLWHIRKCGRSGIEMDDFVSLISMINSYGGAPDPCLPERKEIEYCWHMIHTMPGQEYKRSLLRLKQGGHLYMTALNHMGGRRKLFKTDRDLMGLAPPLAQRGDTIWFFPSSRVPFVLRQCGNNQYKLVGEAYLHGYMHNELANLSGPLQRISLV